MRKNEKLQRALAHDRAERERREKRDAKRAGKLGREPGEHFIRGDIEPDVEK